jgi:hypothetical protein
MLTELRWEKEQALMLGVFPGFQAFTREACFGFEGYLKGKKSGQVYHVVLEAEQANYPQCAPNVRMEPNLGHYWIGQGMERKLCVTRNWQPARSTFANTLLVAIRFLDELDGVAAFT